MKAAIIKQALKKDFTELLYSGENDYDAKLLKEIKYFIGIMKLPNTMKIVNGLEKNAKRHESEKEELARAFESGRL